MGMVYVIFLCLKFLDVQLLPTTDDMLVIYRNACTDEVPCTEF